MSMNINFVLGKLCELRQMVDECIRLSISVTGGPGMHTYIPLEEKYKTRVYSVKEMETDYRSIQAQLKKLEPHRDELVKKSRAKMVDQMQVESDARTAQQRWYTHDGAGLARQRHEIVKYANGKDYHSGPL
jgi:hypothetical protein